MKTLMTKKDVRLQLDEIFQELAREMKCGRRPVDMKDFISLAELLVCLIQNDDRKEQVPDRCILPDPKCPGLYVVHYDGAVFRAVEGSTALNLLCGVQPLED